MSQAAANVRRRSAFHRQVVPHFWRVYLFAAFEKDMPRYSAEYAYVLSSYSIGIAFIARTLAYLSRHFVFQLNIEASKNGGRDSHIAS